MAEERDFDPRLVMEANRSVSFIFRAFDAFKVNPSEPIRHLIEPHVKGAGCDLINPWRIRGQVLLRACPSARLGWSWLLGA